MKDRKDLATGWWRKGDSDLNTAGLCLQANQSFDAACFHAQQAAEKYLKAFMTFRGREFPFIHNLEKLVEMCAADAAGFQQLKNSAQSLTPFAVEARYDEEFWPDRDTARQAIADAENIRGFILARLPDLFPIDSRPEE